MARKNFPIYFAELATLAKTNQFEKGQVNVLLPGNGEIMQEEVTPLDDPDKQKKK